MAGTLGTIMGQVRLDVRQAVAAYAALRAQNARTIYAMRGTGDTMVATGKTFTVAGLAMVYAIGKTIIAAAEFERKMDFFGAVTDTNAKKMERLSAFTLKLAEDTIYSANEIADGLIELGKAGVSAEQIMGGIGEAMANLGAAGDIPLMESGQIITSVVQQYDLAARDAVKVTDLLAGAANASIADITDIGVSLKYVGGVANAAGLTFEDTATAISLLAKAGIRGSTAGTSLRQMIVSFGGATGPAREALSELGILAEDGSNKFYTQEGRLKSLGTVFQILQDHMKGYNQRQRLQLLRTIFNNRALSAASILMREGKKGYQDMNREMSKTTAAEVASERLDNLSGDIEILTGNIQTLMIRAGGPFQKTMRRWVQGLTKLVQAFDDLDPQTQEFVWNTIAITGVVLTLIGIFNLILGTIFRFLAHLKRLGPALKFIGKLFLALLKPFKSVSVWIGRILIAAVAALAAALGVATWVVWAVIAVIAALAIGLIYAYKKFEPFRNAVDSVVDALQKAGVAVAKFVYKLIKEPGKAWDSFKNGIDSIIDAVVNFAQSIPRYIESGLRAAGDAIAGFVSDAIGWFADLGSRVISTVSNFVSKVVGYLSFRNLGYVLGFMIGTAVRLFIGLNSRITGIVVGLVGRVIGFFRNLGPRVVSFLNTLRARAVQLFIAMAGRLISTTARLVSRVISFFRALPGRIISFITRLVAGAVGKMVSFAQQLPEKARQAKDGIINFIKDLPGNIQQLFETMRAKAVAKLQQLKTRALTLAYEIYNAISNTLDDLPGAIAGVLQNCIEAFKQVIQQAYNAAKDFGGGLWNGFKDGIGMNSPSYLERAMWQITGVVDEETKKLAKRTMEVQKLSKKMAATQFGVNGTGLPEPSAAQRYARLASMHSANQNRARTLAAISGRRGAGARAGARRDLASNDVPFVITNWHRGEGYFRDIAHDVVDDSNNYDETVGRMG